MSNRERIIKIHPLLLTVKLTTVKLIKLVSVNIRQNIGAKNIVLIQGS